MHQSPVKTIIDDIMSPEGSMLKVAYMTYGNNQEDSIIFNKSSIDRGLFDITYFHYISVEMKYNEIINTDTSTYNN